jgi:hypothetical protein
MKVEEAKSFTKNAINRYIDRMWNTAVHDIQKIPRITVTEIYKGKIHEMNWINIIQSHFTSIAL